MNDLTLKEVLLAEAYEKEIDGIKEKQKQFIAWLETYQAETYDILIATAKEMLK